MKKLISAIILCLFAVSAPAATIYVDANGTGDYTTIQAAIDNASDNDTIIVQKGIYFENINMQGKIITLRSTDPNDPNIVIKTIIDGNFRGSVVTFSGIESSACLLAGFAITNGHHRSSGAGIYGRGTKATIKNNIISDNVLYSSFFPSSVGGAGVSDCDGLIQYNVISRNEGYCNEGSARGGGLFRCDGIIMDNVIAGNAVGGIVWGICAGGGLYSCNGIIQNNTIVDNIIAGGHHLAGGGIAECKDVRNCIIYGNSEIQIYDSSGSTSVIFSDVQGGWPGLGNIDVDPCFVNAVNGDYHLRHESPCINAGDPNYTPEPNETDLDGLPRVIGGRIDMGCYEFNHCPIADAGPNQAVYAWIDGLADVNLDGSASYDDDSDVLNYYWSWTIDSNLCEANGVAPCITLPVGEHQIQLIVDDGIDKSQPNYCTITVIGPLRAALWILPRAINCNARPQRITTVSILPAGIEPNDVRNEPLIMYPGGIQSKRQFITKMGYGRGSRTVVFAIFDRDDICDALETEGQHQVRVAGWLQSGRCFCGADRITIVTPKSHRWPFRRFYP